MISIIKPSMTTDSKSAHVQPVSDPQVTLVSEIYLTSLPIGCTLVSKYKCVSNIPLCRAVALTLTDRISHKQVFQMHSIQGIGNRVAHLDPHG